MQVVGNGSAETKTKINQMQYYLPSADAGGRWPVDMPPCAISLCGTPDQNRQLLISVRGEIVHL